MMRLVNLKQLHVGCLQVVDLLMCSLVLHLSYSLHHSHNTPQTEHHQQTTDFECPFVCHQRNNLKRQRNDNDSKIHYVDDGPQKSTYSVHPCLQNTPAVTIGKGARDTLVDCTEQERKTQRVRQTIMRASLRADAIVPSSCTPHPKAVNLGTHLYHPFHYEERQNDDREYPEPLFSYFNIMRRMVIPAVHGPQYDIGPHLCTQRASQKKHTHTIAAAVSH